MPDRTTDIVQEHERALLRYAARLLGSQEDAGDVVQEAFLRLLKNNHAKGGLDSIENTRAWLYSVVRNLCGDTFRSKKRKMEISVAPEEFDNVRNAGAAPDAELAAKEDMKTIRQAINELDPRSREIVVLKLEHERSYKEIAQIMDISSSNVGFILHKAMKKLSEKLRHLEQEGAK
jgi:RNA polymerase sigma-70 factor (ECF subfamily)